MDVRVNVSFRNVRHWKDSERRAEHVLDRMQLRGIGITQIKLCVQKGAKRIRPDGVIEAEFRWYKIIYREFQLQDTKKIYPITVLEVANEKS